MVSKKKVPKQAISNRSKLNLSRHSIEIPKVVFDLENIQIPVIVRTKSALTKQSWKLKFQTIGISFMANVNRVKHYETICKIHTFKMEYKFIDIRLTVQHSPRRQKRRNIDLILSTATAIQ